MVGNISKMLGQWGPLLAFYFQGLGPCPGAKPPQCRLTQTARPCLNANIGFVRCHQGSGGHFWDRQGSTSDKHARCVAAKTGKPVQSHCELQLMSHKDR